VCVCECEREIEIEREREREREREIFGYAIASLTHQTSLSTICLAGKQDSVVSPCLAQLQRLCQ
jgi:hypothetical protein